MKNVFIISASVGAGHLRSAQALEAAFKETRPEISVTNIDALKYCNKIFANLYSKGYNKLSNDMPFLWKYLFDHTNKFKKTSKLSSLSINFQSLLLSKLVSLIKEKNPDYILSTHFMPTPIILSLIKKKEINSKLGVVVTDFDIHGTWFAYGADKFFVANEEVAFKLKNLDVPEEKITVTGIPIHPLFSKTLSKETIYKKHNLDKDLPTILILAGGAGEHQIEEILKAAINSTERSQIIAVAGRSQRAKKVFEKVSSPENVKIISFGFINFIEELMEVSNAIVTKSGGLISSECLAKGLPMFIFAPIPGQEERNCDWLLEKGAALRANSVIDLEFKLKKFFKDKSAAEKMKDNIKRIARTDAAFKIVEEVSQILLKG